MRYLVMVFFLLISFTKTGWAIQIVEPAEGAKLIVGTKVRIVVKPDPGEKWKGVYLGFDALKHDPIANIYTDEMTIEQDEDIGSSKFSVIAIDETGKEIELTRTVYIVLPPSVKLESLKVRDDQKTLFMRVGSKRKIYLYGKFSDGVERKLFAATSIITYATSDEKVATVATDGLVTGIGVGQAQITVASGDKKLVIGVSIKPKK